MRARHRRSSVELPPGRSNRRDCGRTPVPCARGPAHRDGLCVDLRRTTDDGGSCVETTTEAKTILICEDEDSLRELVRVSLGDEYHYVEAADGVESIDLARELRPGPRRSST